MERFLILLYSIIEKNNNKFSDPGESAYIVPEHSRNGFGLNLKTVVRHLLIITKLGQLTSHVSGQSELNHLKHTTNDHNFFCLFMRERGIGLTGAKFHKVCHLLVCRL